MNNLGGSTFLRNTLQVTHAQQNATLKITSTTENSVLLPDDKQLNGSRNICSLEKSLKILDENLLRISAPRKSL